MDELLRQVLEETKLLSQSEQTFEYERFEQLVELRQSLTDLVDKHGGLSQDQKLVVREILSYDPIIMSYMQKHKDEATEGLNRIQSYKKQKAAYHQYQDSYDAMMFDQRN